MSSSTNNNKFILDEVKGSMTQRMFQFDTKAAAESTHQSRSDYLHRKQAVLQRPSWVQHAASSVTDPAAESETAKAEKEKKRSEIAMKPIPGTMPAVPPVTDEQKLKLKKDQEAHQAALKMLKQKEHPARGNCILNRKAIVDDVKRTTQLNAVQLEEQKRHENANSNNNNTKKVVAVVGSSSAAQTRQAPSSSSSAAISNDNNNNNRLPPPSSSSNASGSGNRVVKLFSSKGVEVVPEESVEWRRKVQEKQELALGASPLPASSYKNTSLTRAPRKREGAPSQPMAIGDILGTKTNITKTMVDQRKRYDQLEQNRFSHMKEDIQSHGWMIADDDNNSSSVGCASAPRSPLGGRAKTVGDRIYAGLPRALNAQEASIFEEMKKKRGEPECFRHQQQQQQHRN